MINKPKFWDNKIGILAITLFPITLIISFIIFLKKKFIKPKSFNLPIICVGNIYLGGTGKTPSTILLAKELNKVGKKTVVIRNNYKGHTDENDLKKKNNMQ